MKMKVNSSPINFLNPKESWTHSPSAHLSTHSSSIITPYINNSTVNLNHRKKFKNKIPNIIKTNDYTFNKLDKSMLVEEEEDIINKNIDSYINIDETTSLLNPTSNKDIHNIDEHGNDITNRKLLSGWAAYLTIFKANSFPYCYWYRDHCIASRL